MMTQRERIETVYRGGTPDAVPYMLDLSHWFYHRHRLPWDLSRQYDEPERPLIDYHKAAGVGFYMPNLGSFYETRYAPDVAVSARKDDSGRAITWRIETPLGAIERTRVWSDQTYAWGIEGWGIRSEAQLKVLGYAMGRRSFVPRWEKFRAWSDCVGDIGVVYLSAGYSGVGYLMNYWMGVEGMVYAAADWPQTVRDAVDAVNRANLDLIDLLARSPANVVILGDNFSSDIQPPAFFREWSRAYYVEAVRRLHAAGKCAAVHIDGRLRGALRMIRETGADCADAVTPKPMGDLTPAECRDEAGPDFILSGGVSPDLWLPSASDEAFRRAVLDWLALKRRSARLIANAGDQVPPGAAEARIAIMRDLVETHGRYG